MNSTINLVLAILYKLFDQTGHLRNYLQISGYEDEAKSINAIMILFEQVGQSLSKRKEV